MELRLVETYCPDCGEEEDMVKQCGVEEEMVKQCEEEREMVKQFGEDVFCDIQERETSQG